MKRWLGDISWVCHHHIFNKQSFPVLNTQPAATLTVTSSAHYRWIIYSSTVETSMDRCESLTERKTEATASKGCVWMRVTIFFPRPVVLVCLLKCLFWTTATVDLFWANFHRKVFSLTNDMIYPDVYHLLSQSQLLEFLLSLTLAFPSASCLLPPLICLGLHCPLDHVWPCLFLSNPWEQTEL